MLPVLCCLPLVLLCLGLHRSWCYCSNVLICAANQAGVLRSVNNAILLSTISDETVSCFRPSIDVAIPTWIDPRSPMAQAPARKKVAPTHTLSKKRGVGGGEKGERYFSYYSSYFTDYYAEYFRKQGDDL